jgi:thiamine pyrophosphokinase
VNEHIVVISGSAPLAPHVFDALSDEAIILAADGGLDHALAAGLTPSGLIGDLDSVSPAGLAWAEAHATISRHSAEKDQTDTELALAFAADMNPERLTLVGGGDRFDHSVTAIGALGHLGLTSVPRLDGWWNGEHLDVLHGPGELELELAPASTVSLVALQGPCTGVSISGTRWTLDNVDLAPLVGWGVSNEVGRDGAVSIRVSTGVLTIFNAATPSPSTPAPSTPAPPTKEYP